MSNKKFGPQADTILQPYNEPVSISSLNAEFELVQEKRGLAVTMEQRKNAMYICTVLNNVYHSKNRKAGIIYSIPASTGSGKSTITAIYISLLPRYSSKVLIAMRETSEADKIAKEINTFSKHERAVAFHSKNDIKSKLAKEYEVVVITHAMLKQVPSFSNVYKDLILPRTLKVIDEEINFVEFTYLTEKKILLLEYFLKVLSLTYPNLRHYYKSIETFLKKFTIWKIKTYGYTLENKNIPDLSSLEESLKKEAKNICYYEIISDYSSDSSYDKMRTKKKIISIIDTIINMKNYPTFVYTYNNNPCIATAYMKNKLESSYAVLDATSNISGRVELDTNIVQPKIVTHDYSEVETFILNSAHNKNMIIKNETINNLLSKVAFGKKTLLVVNKANVEHAKDVVEKSFNAHHIDISWYGKITGKNDWNDYDTVVVAGIELKSKLQIASEFVARKGTDFFKDSNHINLVEEYIKRDAIAEVIQAITRIRLRITDENGKALSAKVYIVIDSAWDDIFQTYLKEEMTNINISHIDSDELPKPRSGSALDKITVYFSDKKSDTEIEIKDLIKNVPINKSAMSRLIKNNDFISLINGLGLDYITKEVKGSRGRTKTIGIIKKI